MTRHRPTRTPRRLAWLALAVVAAISIGCDPAEEPGPDDTTADDDAIGEDDGAPGDAGDERSPPDDETTTETREVLDGLLRIEVPASWMVTQDTSAIYVAARDEDEISAVLSVAVVPPEDLDDLEAALEDALGSDEAETSATVLEGADEAYRFERETTGGLWQRGVIARIDDGQVVLVLLGSEADVAPSDGLTATILDSIRLHGEPVPQAIPTDRTS